MKLAIKEEKTNVRMGSLIITDRNAYLVCGNSFDTDYSLLCISNNKLLDVQFDTISNIQVYIYKGLDERIIRIISPEHCELREI